MSEEERHSRLVIGVLAACVGVVATCGIVYQLIVGTISTYLLGNSTFQFSLTIGLFMSAYGAGSFLSTRIEKHLTDWFVTTEIALGLFGGLASTLLFYLYASSELFEVGRVVLIGVIGTLVGLEIPLLIRISETHRQNLRVTVGQMMGFDYIGALVGGIAFPLVLLPAWGLLGASFLIGICNTIVALLTVWVFRDVVSRPKMLFATCFAVIALLSAGAMTEGRIERAIEGDLYEDPVAYLEQSEYQRLVVTKYNDDVRLYLDGSLQFSSRDEYRYHEVLVHPAAMRVQNLKDVLILGGGDGLVLRELRNYSSVENVTLVDLDPAVVNLARTNADLKLVNLDSFAAVNPTIIHEDAFTWAERGDKQYDLVIIDLPDPHHESLAKLYSVAFYRSLRKRLRDGGVLVAQLGSPFFARDTYWTSVRTLEKAGWSPRAFHVQVPSFGEWGFAMAGTALSERPLRSFSGKFYDTDYDAELFRFPPDMQPPALLSPNTLIRPVIVERFRDDWRRWN